MEGELLQPRGLVRVNGETMAGWVSFETEANEFSSPDTFRVSFAMSDLPASRDAAWWASQGKFTIELFAGFPADPDFFEAQDLESVFYGQADDLTLDYQELTVEVAGRDLTAAFVDNKTSEKFVNRTSSQIAQALAAKYGLQANVTPTSAKVGTYYTLEHVDLKSDRTEWDLLTWLARQEGFRVYTKGKTLYFQPAPTSTTPFVLERITGLDGPDQWNGQDVKFSRTLTVAKDIRVTVTSWNNKTKKAFSRVATRSKKGSGADVQKYSYRIGNLTPEDAQQRANKILAEISRHEMRLEFAGPADTSLSMDSVIQVRGTDTEFDQTYFPQAISRRMSVDAGFGWEVSAKNHSPESEATL